MPDGALVRSDSQAIDWDLHTFSQLSREWCHKEKTSSELAGFVWRENCLVVVRGQRSGWAEWLETVERQQPRVQSNVSERNMKAACTTHVHSPGYYVARRGLVQKGPPDECIFFASLPQMRDSEPGTNHQSELRNGKPGSAAAAAAAGDKQLSQGRGAATQLPLLRLIYECIVRALRDGTRDKG